ncbi:DinB family protein [Pedobacter sp. BS3]|uniref:DinB family protein n=1 Tax=Pedobacter sp. BS3 TaxID=2567937 RepID=UPI0011EC13A4|nr:DinB family protein [Pedobacter sp. BS3]TZF83211.1 DinB family protein [Pedobacter sp. BS3]
MQIIELLLKEMEQEAQTTRKMLSRVPADKFNWQPHPKSMILKRLATHVAELPSWVTMTLTTSELDFASSPYNPKDIKSTEELVNYFEECWADGKAHLEKAQESDLTGSWTLRNGDEIYSTSTRYEVIRMAFCQIVHHRAQLGVYLRLLDIPLPGSYGPSADESDFS